MSHSDQIAQAAELLRDALNSLALEIDRYPTPISGCDAQFNHLLAERSKIEATLRALDKSVFIPTPRQLNPDDPVETR